MVFTGNDRVQDARFKVGDPDSYDSADAISGAKDESDVRKTIKTMNRNS